MATKIWVGTDSGNEGDWGTAANWSPSGVPVNSDDVYLENSSQDVTGTLDQSAVTLSSLNIAGTYTGTIGTSSTYLQIGATTCNIGYHTGPGTPTHSGRIMLNFGSVQTTVNVEGSASTGTDSNLEPIRLIGSHASNAINVTGGNVGIATNSASETATMATVNVAGGTIRLSDGVTNTTTNINTGSAEIGCAATTLTVRGGSVRTFGSGAITTLVVDGGTVEADSSGTVTTARVAQGGTLDFSGDTRSKTVTNCEMQAGATLLEPNNAVTFTNGIDLLRCGPQDVTLVLASHVTLTPSSV